MTTIADQSVIAAARDAFLSTGAQSPHIRDATMRAWRRSLAAGARSDAEPAIVLPGGLDPDSTLLRAVEPVAAGMMDQLGTADFAMMVMDRDAYVAGRWVSGPAMSRLLDSMGVMVGAQFDESVVGSTGLGTVLEDRGTAIVDGAEHFNRRFDPVIAVGAPVIHPGTGCVEGVLDLVCPTGTRPELLVALIERAAREVGERLLSGFAAQDRALLDAFLKIDRRGPRRPVLAINRRMFMANNSADVLVGARPHAALWRVVSEALRAGQSTLALPSDSGVQLHAQIREVGDTRSAIGALLQLTARPTAGVADVDDRTEGLTRALLASMPGRSALWQSAIEAVARGAIAGGRLLLFGPAGSGKTALAETVVNWLNNPAASTSEPRCGARLIDDLDVQSRSDVDLLRTRLGSGFQLLTVATTEGLTTADLDDRLLGEFEHVVEVPDLSRRPEDVADIATRMVGRISDGRVALTVDALRILQNRTWRGNGHQLHRVLNAAVARAHGSRIQPADLPAELAAAPAARKKLNYLENVERDAIAALLSANQGNKRRVAEVLGISRSTLYRKMTALDLD